MESAAATGDVEREASPGSPLLSGGKDSEKLYGVTEQEDSTKYTASSSGYSKHSSKPTTTTSCGCCFYFSLSVALVFVLIFAFIAGFGALSYIPYPTTTTIQGVQQGDTVPVYFSNKRDIPNGPNTYWYQSVTSQVNSANELNTNVSFVFVNGKEACMPLNIKVESFESENITLSDGDVLTLVDAIYLPLASTVDLDINLFNGSSKLYIVDDNADYNCFIDRTRNDCKYEKVYSLEGSSNAIDFHPDLSSYFYFVLITEGEVTFDYNYTSMYSYYNISDYDASDVYQTCTIEPDESSSQVCEFELSNRRGCLIVSSPTPENEEEEARFIELSVHVVHERFTVPSVACLTLAGGFFILFLCGLIVYAWVSWRRRSGRLRL